MNGRDVYRRANLGAAALLAAVLVAPWFVVVSADGGSLGLRATSLRVPELCLTKRLTGQACRTCGLGRSVVLASRLDFEQSRDFHPGGRWLWSWTAVATLLRLAVAVVGVPRRYWWLDLGVMAGSFVVVSLIVVLAR
jgi:hypothetical protein